ncbi:MAG: hypothetical protein DCC44_12295, partial [Acidobacteria bacterium]
LKIRVSAVQFRPWPPPIIRFFCPFFFNFEFPLFRFLISSFTSQISNLTSQISNLGSVLLRPF